MKLGIMQPYFFPYIGYFSLIDYADRWIVFDTVQYIERGWVNRNRIIHPTQPEYSYITVPLKAHKQNAAICDVMIKSDKQYIERITGQLTASYKKRAPYFKEVTELVKDCLNAEKRNLSMLNVIALDKVCKYIGIPFSYEVFSEMDLAVDDVNDAGEWALNISKALGADEYVNPPGGVALFDEKKFNEAEIKLTFLKSNLTPYNQKKAKFIEGLSIIDVMMFNSPEEIRDMLKDYSLFEK